MSEYLLAKYRPVADRLLAIHGMSVDASTHHMLATDIMHARELERDTEPRSHSPLPAANKALTHARKLIQYAESPPRRKGSVPNRCRKLRAALLEDSPLPCCLGMHLANKKLLLDLGELLDSLEAGGVDRETLTMLANALNAITTGPSDWQSVGRPWGLAKPIIRGGCMAWTIAGNRRLTYRWDDGEGALTGSLPDFLRDLLACCAGTHALMQEMEQRRKPASTKAVVPIPRGDGLHLSDASLKLAIIACSQDVALQKYLHKNTEHI